VGKFAASIERQKVKNVSASGGFALALLTRGSIPGLCWELFIGASQFIWGASNSLAPALIKRIYARVLIFLTSVNSLTR